LWEYETALRDECGFDGSVPYWDAPRFSDDQTRSKVFDGSETSLGGNGRYQPDDHGPYLVVVPGLAREVSAVFSLGNGTGGTGGGCVEDGPFAEGKYEISLGPVDKPYVDEANKFGLQPNRRCLRRNFDPVSGSYLSWENATKVLSSPDIDTFRPLLSANFHKDTHGFIGRDGVDLFTPPNEPAFFLLHALIDRFWAIWQGQDRAHREYLLSGNRTFNGVPLETAPEAPMTNNTLDDVLWLRPGYEPLVRDGMSSSANGRCFIYL
jgi:tyrosinase